MNKYIPKITLLFTGTSILLSIQQCKTMEQQNKKKIEPQYYYLRLSLLYQTYKIANNKLEDINKQYLEGKPFTNQTILEYNEASLAETQANRKLEELYTQIKKPSPEKLEEIAQIKENEYWLSETIKDFVYQIHNKNDQ